MQDCFTDIIRYAEAPEDEKSFNDIMAMMSPYGICFDDGLGNSNNLIHRSNFILIEEYFTVDGGEDL